MVRWGDLPDEIIEKIVWLWAMGRSWVTWPRCDAGEWMAIVYK